MLTVTIEWASRQWEVHVQSDDGISDIYLPDDLCDQLGEEDMPEIDALVDSAIAAARVDRVVDSLTTGILSV